MSTINQPKVFIIILHYGDIKDTKECLSSLEKLDYPNFEVVVVDNGTGKKFKVKSSKLKVKLIRNEENLGFAGGNNVGIRYALKHKADYILLLNNDTIVEPGLLKELIRVGESDKNIGILGPIIYKKQDARNKKQTIHFAGGKINWLYTKGIHLQDTRHKIQDTNRVDYITGACMLVKREVIEKIGLMPEEYFLYCEDVDWCLKARKVGYKCVLVPWVKIWHKVSASTKEFSFSYIYYHTRNGLLLAKRNAPFLIKILVYLKSFWMLAKQIAKFIILPSKRKWAKAIMRGIIDFYIAKTGQLK